MSQRCPRCGHENPEGTLFCEECDWRLDIPYVPERRRNPLTFTAVTFVCGMVALACGFVDGAETVALILGAAALIVGGYTTGLVRLVPSDRSSAYLTLSAAGLLFGVVGFVLGFASVLGAMRWRSIAESTSSRASRP